jgi:hypothetical protein
LALSLSSQGKSNCFTFTLTLSLTSSTIFLINFYLFFFTFFTRLCAAEKPYQDGTFKVPPDPFFQFYTIGHFILDRFVPGIYCIMTGKSQLEYVNLFTFIRDEAGRLNIPFNWTSSMSDYETGLMPAIREVFGAFFGIDGCHFHYTQCLLRMLQQLGMLVSCYS